MLVRGTRLSAVDQADAGLGLHAQLCASLLLAAFTPAAAKEGAAWLAANGQKDGVVSLPSGLQYKVLRRGHGDAHPAPGSSCECHYKGQQAVDWPEGPEFDSSYSRGSPSSFAPNQVIGGWTEAMQLMVEGDTWELYIPSELAYGARGSPPSIKPDATLVFTIEIIKINGEKVPAAPRCDVGTLEGCTEEESKYVAKQQARIAPERAAEIKRLQGLVGTKAAPAKVAWIRARLHLLMLIVAAGGGEVKSEL
eukprot:CAMPEP_0179855988 /NCGR_PEP_ID=MMETSP0982-20121206/10864_1 /TAXON_ID=483367 /ORGANISM="non described non described, Strain CCMP 2436" /LENGTH=250 /DNA_ID=CAMNT_0021742185 /DNA_START=221 /DNA_END=974 /DNA_ORIENTATION=-